MSIAQILGSRRRRNGELTRRLLRPVPCHSRARRMPQPRQALRGPARESCPHIKDAALAAREALAASPHLSWMKSS